MTIETTSPGEVRFAKAQALNQRDRRAYVSALCSLVARTINIITGLISVPLTLHYLGAERYGVWMTITSFTAILGFADLGMGNGLLNEVSFANGKDDPNAASKAISNAFFLLSGVAAVLLCLLLLLSLQGVRWENLFNLTSPLSRAEFVPAMATFTFCFALNLPLGISQKVQLAYQEGYAANLWQILGSALGFAGLLLVVRVKGGLPWLIVATSGGPLLAAAMNYAVLFGVNRPWLRPTWVSFDWKSCHAFARQGVMFLLIQVLSIVSLQFDTLLIARSLGQTAVTEYSILARVFNMLTILPMLLVTQLWPAYGEAFVRRDYSWIRKTLFHTTAGTVVSIFLAIVLFLTIGPWCFQYWLGSAVNFSLPLAVAMACGTLAMVSSHPCGTFLMATNSLRFVTAQMIAVAAISIPAKIVLLQSHGLVGLAWSNAIPYLAIATIPGMIYTYRRLMTLEPEPLDEGIRHGL